MRTLLVVYHRPFWRGPDGSLWEREGALSRYLESLSPHFERIMLAAPETQPAEDGHRLAADNIGFVPLPFYDSLSRFFLALPAVLIPLWTGIGQSDLVNIRMPTPAGA